MRPERFASAADDLCCFLWPDRPKSAQPARYSAQPITAVSGLLIS